MRERAWVIEPVDVEAVDEGLREGRRGRERDEARGLVVARRGKGRGEGAGQRRAEDARGHLFEDVGRAERAFVREQEARGVEARVEERGSREGARLGEGDAFTRVERDAMEIR